MTYRIFVQREALPPPAVRSEKLDWQALTTIEQLAVTGYLQDSALYPFCAMPERSATFIRRYKKEQ
jgi:hypothetical protein